MDLRHLIRFILAAYIVLLFDLVLLLGGLNLYLFLGGNSALTAYLGVGLVSVLSFPQRRAHVHMKISPSAQPAIPRKSNYWSWQWITA